MEVWETIEFGTRALSLKAAMTQPLQEILDVQRARLESLVRHAKSKSSFYRDKYADIDPNAIELQQLPISTKSEIMEHFDAALTVDDVRREEVEKFLQDSSNLGRYFRDRYVLSHTSGSQGQPLLIVQPKEALELLFALQVSRGNHEQLTVWEAMKHLVQPARLAAIILERGFYPSACAFDYMPEGARQFLEVLPIALSADDLLEQIDRFRPTHLTAYASVLHELAREVEQGNLSLQPELKQVVNISERLMPQARTHYAQIFGAPVLDDYAMGECLFLTNGCVSTGGMHVNADWAILEVVDDDYRPVPVGTRGSKLLITNLINHVQPIIRYEVGDIVTMAEVPCDCGNNLPRIEKVDGRDSDMFYIEDNEGLRPFSPAVLELAIGHATDVREYQLVQHDPHEMRILIEPLPKAKVDLTMIQQAVNERLRQNGIGPELRVEMEVVDKLVPQDGNKFKRVVSHVSSSGSPPKENSQAE